MKKILLNYVMFLLVFVTILFIAQKSYSDNNKPMNKKTYHTKLRVYICDVQLRGEGDCGNYGAGVFKDFGNYRYRASSKRAAEIKCEHLWLRANPDLVWESCDNSIWDCECYFETRSLINQLNSVGISVHNGD